MSCERWNRRHVVGTMYFSAGIAYCVRVFKMMGMVRGAGVTDEDAILATDNEELLKKFLKSSCPNLEAQSAPGWPNRLCIRQAFTLASTSAFSSSLTSSRHPPRRSNGESRVSASLSDVSGDRLCPSFCLSIRHEHALAMDAWTLARM